METAVSANVILWLAFAIGCVFGGIGQKTHFCTMGAVSDIVNMVTGIACGCGCWRLAFPFWARQRCTVPD
jgi:hypothetical protein